ncbi:hypothetical protein [Lichenifustis flavocetrariae]|uniref:Capsule assembly Wzi family protein n=1 Tax=Lichenifustis flavocetrariae TaxID=2949735 RepID=A0AA42CJT1_9HYPH|nr:hypothetical protein [Lichenifustis flavocetrariae]MCW6509814.1 hypothetical protein [Lichenifustis flavocetrariae]
MRSMLFTIVVATLAPTAALAAGETNAELMQKLYAQLAANLRVGDQKLSPNQNMLILAAPAILVDPSLKLENPDDAANLVSNLTDKILLPSAFLDFKPGRMSDVYQEILRNHSVPEVILAAGEKAELEKATNALYTPAGKERQLMTDYNTYSGPLQTANENAATWQSQNVGKPLTLKLVNEIKKALTPYIAHRGDTAQGDLLTIQKYGQRNGEFYFDSLRTRFAANWFTENYYGRTLLYPSYPTWLNKDNSWQNIKITSNMLDQRTHDEHSEVGGGLSASWGLFSVGGDYAEDETKHNEQVSTSNMLVSFDVLRVGITYAWMDANLFDSQMWDWSRNSQYAGQKLSSGADYDKGQTPSGIMPAIPVELLVARNLTLSADWSVNIKEFVEKHSGGGGSFGWGPFKLGGRTNKSSKDSYVHAEGNGNAVTFDSPQIIGYIVHFLPNSPNRARVVNGTPVVWPDEPRTAAVVSSMGTESSADPLIQAAQTLIQSGAQE